MEIVSQSMTVNKTTLLNKYKKIGFNCNCLLLVAETTPLPQLKLLNRSEVLAVHFFFIIIWDYACRNNFITHNFPWNVIVVMQTMNEQCKLNVCGFTGTKPGSHDCTLRNEDALEKHFMKIETEPLASSFKSCSPQQQQNPGDGAELHIINIPENVSTR